MINSITPLRIEANPVTQTRVSGREPEKFILFNYGKKCEQMGKAVPVVDLRLKFGMTMAEKTVNTCVIIVDIIWTVKEPLRGRWRMPSRRYSIWNQSRSSRHLASAPS